MSYENTNLNEKHFEFMFDNNGAKGYFAPKKGKICIYIPWLFA